MFTKCTKIGENNVTKVNEKVLIFMTRKVRLSSILTFKRIRKM